MGQSCCSGGNNDKLNELATRYPANGQSLDGKHYTLEQLIIIVRCQAAMRGWLARKRVQELRQQIFQPGMHHYPQDGREDYDNVNVQVSLTAMLRSFNTVFIACLGNEGLTWRV